MAHLYTAGRLYGWTDTYPDSETFIGCYGGQDVFLGKPSSDFSQISRHASLYLGLRMSEDMNTLRAYPHRVFFELDPLVDSFPQFKAGLQCWTFLHQTLRTIIMQGMAR